MFKVILISHGNLASAMLETAQMLAGKQEDVVTFGLCLGDDIETFSHQVREAMMENMSEEGVLVLTDIQSGSPFNATVGAMEDPRIRHITGMNLPMFIEVLFARQYRSLEEVCETLVVQAKETIVDVNVFLNSLQEDDE